LGISLDRGDPNEMKSFVKKHGIRFPIGLDPKYRAAQQYGVQGTPTSFLISPNGKLLGVAPGPRQWDSESAQSIVKELLKNEN
jgi:peroxiredoxin